MPFGDDPNDLPLMELHNTFNTSLVALFDKEARQPPPFIYDAALHSNLIATPPTRKTVLRGSQVSAVKVGAGFHNEDRAEGGRSTDYGGRSNDTEDRSIDIDGRRSCNGDRLDRNNDMPVLKKDNPIKAKKSTAKRLSVKSSSSAVGGSSLASGSKSRETPASGDATSSEPLIENNREGSRPTEANGGAGIGSGGGSDRGEGRDLTFTHLVDHHSVSSKLGRSPGKTQTAEGREGLPVDVAGATGEVGRGVDIVDSESE